MKFRSKSNKKNIVDSQRYRGNVFTEISLLTNTNVYGSTFNDFAITDQRSKKSVFIGIFKNAVFIALLGTPLAPWGK